MRTRALNHPKQQARIGLKVTFSTESKWSNTSYGNDFLLVIAWRQRSYMQWYDDGRRNAKFTFRFVKSSRRLQIRCWNTQIFLKCKNIRQLCLKQGVLKVKCSCKNEPEVCPNNTDFIFTPFFSTKLWKPPRLSFSLLFLVSWTQFAIVSCIQVECLVA